MADPVTVVSVDLDDLECYAAIHGLQGVSQEGRTVALGRWVPRMLEFFDRMQVRATLFVIGRDVERDLNEQGRGAMLLQQAAQAGHELGNHSFSHAYDFIDRGRARIREDIRSCDRVLRDLGVVPVGFRAPGYTHDRVCLEEVGSAGYRYDSSRLPSPPYYLAKAALIAWGRLQGRRSASMIRGWGSFAGGSRPQFLSSLQLWEFPVSVTPRLRLPLVGTALLAAPPLVFERLCRTIVRQDYFHLELHGIDFADPARDPLPAGLIGRQPGLATRLPDRLARLERLLRMRSGAGPVCSLLPDL